MKHKTLKQNVLLVMLSVVMIFSLLFGVSLNLRSQQASADSVEPVKYTVEITQMTTQSFYIANAQPLEKGESLTMEFTVKAINQYDQDSWRYRFAKVINVSELGEYCNGNTTGTNWYINGAWVTYNNASTRKLPFSAGMQCKFTLSPKDETGDTYAFAWYMNDKEIKQGTLHTLNTLVCCFMALRWKCF